jgi:hypothetical protein
MMYCKAAARFPLSYALLAAYISVHATYQEIMRAGCVDWLSGLKKHDHVMTFIHLRVEKRADKLMLILK